MNFNKLAYSLVLSASFVSTASYAAGYMFSELGELSTSTAGAGVAALAEGAETAFANPAGMTRLKGKNIATNLGLLNLDSKYYDMGTENYDGLNHFSNESTLKKILPLASFYFTNAVNNELSIGLSMGGTGGAGFSYSDGFAGSIMAEEGLLLTTQLNPSVAYKVSEQMSVGAGISIEYAFINQTFGTAAFDASHDYVNAEVNADDISFGWNIGAMYEPNEGNRFGFAYRSKIEHELNGNLKANVSSEKIKSQINIIMPAQAKLSGYHAVQENLALLWTVGWQDLSAVKQTDVIVGGHNSPLVRDWQDTYSAAIGGHFRVNSDFRLEIGYSYETSPQNDPKQIFVDVPTGPISKYSAGFTWSINRDTKAQVYYEYLDGGTVRTEANDNLSGGLLTQLNGVYDMNVHFIGANLNYAF
ncbi:OmpP1/FadL family transporter [Vibrio diabolicus]|uniref:OmpP1/FadL family transporter n=1 Tax=Vibrio diabolicus TaxID=50719 RepID=UPI0015F5A2B6|nr:outer membrane protein transport protein [Vibrio diabolicus]